ncbi:serine/threonine-protein phosphatase 7 long form [Cinnamomum micranthum f. kanehirae]|uniref:Serine/threonine-protein phosphatase 7 long form n=1 Tax=Cinnamomum micranthum f. kanehirae TaxID=337451 RepID=A0A3S3N4F0_9MAGN|nr:serine/threonine-protein phosphatase 7 long form [Cinnamomum micranthum f. kanehirae]
MELQIRADCIRTEFHIRACGMHELKLRSFGYALLTKYVQYVYLVIANSNDVYFSMPPRRVRRASSSTSGRDDAISSPSTSRDRSGIVSSSTTDHHRSTASERRRKAQQDPSPDPIDELEEDVAVQEATYDDITDKDAHLLILEERVDEDHHAGPIPDRDALRCICHWPKLRSWYLQQLGEDNHVPGFHAIKEESGLAPLTMHLSYRHIDCALVSAYVERWQPETNTLHLPFGEMTITLDEVSAILGISVVGTPVHAPTQLSFIYQISLLERGFRVDRGAASAELSLARGGVVRLSWIKQMCSDVTPKSSTRRIECAARGYLLYLLGCTLFVEKSTTRVSIFYLELLMEVGHIRHYAWGAATWAYLYRQLGQATRIDVHRAVNHLRAAIARTGQPADVYYRALQTTLEILEDLPVTYKRRL